MKQHCPTCEREAVRADDSVHNVVYVCPDCGAQLDVATAAE